MDAILKRIANTIVDVAREENQVLYRVGKGIFLMPEGAFVYLVGRALALNAEKIFGTSKVEWSLESPNGDGPTDLMFEVVGGPKFAFEFKRARDADHINDIRKLARLNNTFERLFVALMSRFPENLGPDVIFSNVEQPEVKTKRLPESGHFDFFATLHESYPKRPNCCVVGIWRICT